MTMNNPSNTRRLFFAVAIALLLSGCGGGSSRQSPVPAASAPTAASATQQFMDSVAPLTGNFTITGAPPTVTFAGYVSKYKTSDPRVLGGAHFLTNSSLSNYRIISFAYVLDKSSIQPGEAAESDIGLTVLPQGQLVALNSGEEVLMDHQYDVDTSLNPVSYVNIPAGGLSLPSGNVLSVGSVSAIFPASGGGGAEVINTSRTASGTFMALYYKVVLMRSDLVSAPKLESYRSPYRDRSYVADPNRVFSPSTSFKNTSPSPVTAYGVDIFLSNLSDSQESTHSVNILVDGHIVTTLHLPPHIPGTTTPLIPMIFPEAITIQPGATVTVQGVVTPTRAIVFDFASYLLATPGLTPTGEKLDIIDTDLNGDGYPDIVDIDANGSVWVSLREGGLQQTEQEWARGMKNVDAVSISPTSPASGPPNLRLTNAQGLCIDLYNNYAQDQFFPAYCGTAPDPSSVWGDFNGDGWPDRLRVDATNKAYYVALGGPSGLGQDIIWLGGYGAADKMFEYDGNGDGLGDLEIEWSDSNGFNCRILRSTGSAFNVIGC